MHVAKQLLGIIIDNVVGRLPSGLFTVGKFTNLNAEIIEINQESKKIVFFFKRVLKVLFYIYIYSLS